MTSNSAVPLVENMIRQAINKRASDIHLEAARDGLYIRYRIDGVLYPEQRIAPALMSSVLSRIKVLAQIDIAERRLPHDGKFCFDSENNSVDCRVSTFPSLYGEKMVVRILNRNATMISLESLGFSQEIYNSFTKLINRAQGFFLVTGPTGSGKTTTLYAALNALKAPDKNFVTLEDPIEYSLDNITQSAVHPEIGFTFACGIRALLRQDPDVIMVGEIRDQETAHVAIQAALTGHVVLSTVHTNDAAGTVMRLIDMGIEPCLINASLTGVLAQRLARKICEHCKQPSPLTEREKEVAGNFNLNVEQSFTGVGCDACMGLGYKGRIGLFELLIFSHGLKRLIKSNPVFEDIYEQAKADGMKTLLADGICKVNEGLISFSELVKVLL